MKDAREKFEKWWLAHNTSDLESMKETCFTFFQIGYKMGHETGYNSGYQSGYRNDRGRWLDRTLESDMDRIMGKC